MRQTLVIHPDSHAGAVRGVAGSVARPEGQSSALTLEFVVAGDIAALRLPPKAEPARADELWKRTCFEAFVRPANAEAYFEFNFSPSAQWAAYAFDAYRSGMRPVDNIAAPRISVRSEAKRFTLRVDLDAGLLPQDAPWRVGLCAIIEHADGEKSYWALAHPPGAPDFHHRDGFMLERAEAERT